MIYIQSKKIDCNSCSIALCNNLRSQCCTDCSIRVICHSNKIETYVSKWAIDIPLKHLSLADRKCGGIDNGTYYVFVTSLTACNTQLFTRNTQYIIYKNEILDNKNNSLFSLTCSFKRKIHRDRTNIAIRYKSNRYNKNHASIFITTLDGRRTHKNSLLVNNSAYVYFEVKGPTYLKAYDLVMGLKKCSLDTITINGFTANEDVIVRDG